MPIGQTGNTFSPSIKVGSSYVNIESDIKITKNESGVATIKVVADLTKDAKLAKLNNIIPAEMKDKDGKFNAELKYKITSEGIQDYFFNKDGKPQTIAKFDAKVGDKYEATKTNGTIITRTVTERTDKDDFSYGYMYIKTIAVEQNSKMAGVSKVRFRVNHKFGLVFIEFVMEDASTVSMSLTPATNN